MWLLLMAKEVFNNNNNNNNLITYRALFIFMIDTYNYKTNNGIYISD